MNSTKTKPTRNRGRLLAAAMAAVAAASLTATLPAVAASGADEAPSVRVQIKISKAAAFDAPIGKKGGVSNPVALCSNYRVEPKTVWTLTNTDTGWTRTYRWTGSYPGMYFPRVRVGTYKSVTSASCRRADNTRVETVMVKEKTLDGTVSKGEWADIRRGMSRAQVADIVGSGGRDPYRYDGTLTLTYDMMSFWRWSLPHDQGNDGLARARDWHGATASPLGRRRGPS